ncbi:DUF4905 domain-containing protein [Desertivirga brevis]|uniref:DUF4905 domain-containing protein n=1 Tax=Desertivirga brevis TaxID=2810310 RepID=UPI001A95D044|nr:DUF4905 domain-containing protein [Pedobacter sp. SYSU D00873]
MLSGSKYIKPSLNEKFKGIIWKIEIDDKFPVVAIESRHAETHTASFSAFNFATGECLFREITVEDSWKWSLDRVSNGRIFIHSYLAEETPEHQGIIAFTHKGTIAWQQHNKALQDIAEEGLIVTDSKIQGKWIEILDPENGATIKSFAADYKPVLRDIIVPTFIYDRMLVPISLPDNTVGEIAFKEHNNKMIACYHTANENTFTQTLRIAGPQEVLLEDNLALNILKRNPEAFFISHNHLFCIRDEKREIVSYLV